LDIDCWKVKPIITPNIGAAALGGDIDFDNIGHLIPPNTLVVTPGGIVIHPKLGKRRKIKAALDGVVKMRYSANDAPRDKLKNLVPYTGQFYTLMNGDQIPICDCRRELNYAQKINTTSKYFNSAQSLHILECQAEGDKTVNSTGSKKFPTHAATSMRLAGTLEGQQVFSQDECMKASE
jgi:hypothetical protein